MSESVLFEAVIVPHRSLSRRGLRRLVAGIAAACTVNASIFVIIGAWPVAGFTGLELLLAAVLLRVNVLGARASELLLLTQATLRIVRTDRSGGRSERSLPAGWLRAELRERPGRVPRLLLIGHGIEEEVATSLGEAEKRDLATALGESLHRLRHPQFDNRQLRHDAVSSPSAPSS